MTPIITVFLISVGLAILTQIVNKLLINEKKIDENNAKMKENQQKMKGLDPKSPEFAKLQEQVLDISLSNMKQQFKPMLVTLLPFLLMIQFVGALYAFTPIEMNSTVKFMASGNGHLEVPCLGIDNNLTKSVSNSTVFTGDCKAVFGNSTNVTIDLLGKNKISRFEAEDIKLSVSPPKLVFVKLPFSLPFIGNSIGWLGTYVAFSLLFSTVLNKALKKIHLRKWE